MSTQRQRRPDKPPFWSSIPGLLTALAGFVTAVTALFALFLPHGSGGDTPASPTATPSLLATKFVTVISTRHIQGADGRFFDFYASELDAALTRATWDDQTLWVSREPDGPRRPAEVWRTPSGGPGDAHGRYNDGEKKNDWHTGDHIYVFDHPGK